MSGALSVRFTGALADLSSDARREIVERARTQEDAAVTRVVSQILARVRKEGDAALVDLARQFDRATIERLEVPRDVIEGAKNGLDAEVRRALERTRANLEKVHRAFIPALLEVESEPGIIVGRRPDPLAAVGIYAPGGRAAYPSSVLMGVVPARVVGAPEIVVCSPPGKNGLPSPVVLAAAAIGGATRVFSVGGAQAIAALAFGTESVPRVDRIVGPGNAYVAEAKRQIAGSVGIDAPAGPSEILVVADDTADPEHIARELAAQAEHDPEASCVALVVGEALAARVASALARVVVDRSDVVAASLGSRGAVLSVDSLDEAWPFAADYAAEHLMLLVREPRAALGRVRHAGTVFFGDGSSVAFGDYMTGANHVLPTAGAGRSFSGLSTLDFVRFTTYQTVSREAAARMAGDVAVLAEAEGLRNHAAAAAAFAGPSSSVASPSPQPSPGGGGGVTLGVRAGIAGMTLYASNREPCAVDLSDNTNQRGAPPGARGIVARTELDGFARYPNHYAADLKRAIGARLGVGVDEIVTGCGSDDVLDSAIRAFATPGGAVAYPDPTFAMIPYFARVNELEPRPVPLLGPERGWDIDAEALLAARASITYLCSPNNPTGTRASAEAIERILAEASGVVLLDEAYVEYCGGSLVRRAKSEGRLLVVRTFSKAFGLAGARVGYAVGAPELVSAVEKSRGPYKVTALAERMAIAALQDDVAWVDAGIRDVLSARERFVAFLERRKLAPLPSAANFVLVPVKDAAGRAKVLRQRGVAVRPFSALPGIGDALRISIAPWEIMEPVLSSFEEVLSCA